MKHLIIGAGVSGLVTASTYIENEIPVIIYERQKEIGGIWNVNTQHGLVNPESIVQVDPVIYRPSGDYSPIHWENPWKSINVGPEQVMENCRNMVEKKKIDIVFGREVVKFHINEDKTISVCSRDVESKEEREEVFGGLHIRTGSLDKRRDVYFKGQDLFKGIISHSLRGDIKIEDFQGKEVVIVGGGAFALEHTLRALRGGANKITLISRKSRIYLSQYSTYLFTKLYGPNAFDPAKIQEIWESSIEHTKNIWKLTGTEEIGLPNLRKVNGHEHFLFSDAFSPLNSDIFLLGCHYGIVEFIEDKVDHLKEHSVVTKSGREIHADYFIKSLGFICDLSLLRNYNIHDSFFIEGLANVTSNINGDGILGSKLLGPDIPAANILLLSYYLVANHDLVSIFFHKNPEKFEKFRKIPTFATILTMPNLDYVEILKLLSKVFISGENELIDQLYGKMLERQKMYDELLPEKKFLEHHKREWESIVEILADRTGKEKIPYPLNNLLV